jgi:hypothetical protein
MQKEGIDAMIYSHPIGPQDTGLVPRSISGETPRRRRKVSAELVHRYRAKHVDERAGVGGQKVTMMARRRGHDRFRFKFIRPRQTEFYLIK